MKLTIIQTGEVPAALRSQFGPYPAMFHRMFCEAGEDFMFETVPVHDGAPLPDAARPEGIVITGSAAGVYDTHYPWMEPLRVFIRSAYAARTPMFGVCFGHQIMADALGGDVGKSEKGWGLGRHVYAVRSRPAFLAADVAAFSVACSHQDQVLSPPPEAEVFLGSAFTPNAGLVYRNGATISLQPHPEFDDAYTAALAELRRGKAPDSVVDEALASLATASQSRELAGYVGEFLRGAQR